MASDTVKAIEGEHVEQLRKQRLLDGKNIRLKERRRAKVVEARHLSSSRRFSHAPEWRSPTEASLGSVFRERHVGFVESDAIWLAQHDGLVESRASCEQWRPSRSRVDGP